MSGWFGPTVASLETGIRQEYSIAYKQLLKHKQLLVVYSIIPSTCPTHFIIGQHDL